MEGRRPLALAVCLVALGIGGALADQGHVEPQSVTATCGASSAEVSWAAIQDPHLTGYSVFDRVSGTSEFTQANGALVTATTYEVTGLSSSTEYDFGVKAVYEDGESVMSALASCTTG